MWKIISVPLPSLVSLLPRLKYSSGFIDNSVTYCHLKYNGPITNLVVFLSF